MRNLFLLCLAGLALIAGLYAWGPGPYVSPRVQAARALWRAGEGASARQAAAAALPALRREVELLPGDLERRLALAEALVLAGERERGLAEARRAVAADPAPWVARRRGAVVYESPLETLEVVASEAGAQGEAIVAHQAILAHAGRAGSPAGR